MNAGADFSTTDVACLNPLLIGAQCELIAELLGNDHYRLNPLLIGAQCELAELKGYGRYLASQSPFDRGSV